MVRIYKISGKCSTKQLKNIIAMENLLIEFLEKELGLEDVTIFVREE